MTAQYCATLVPRKRWSMRRARYNNRGGLGNEKGVDAGVFHAPQQIGSTPNSLLLPPSETLFARTFSLAHHILGPLIGPEPEIDGLTEFALAGPLRELHLGNQRGPDPRRDGLVFHFGRKG
jgi:hypothetical protein